MPLLMVATVVVVAAFATGFYFGLQRSMPGFPDRLIADMSMPAEMAVPDQMGPDSRERGTGDGPVVLQKPVGRSRPVIALAEVVKPDLPQSQDSLGTDSRLANGEGGERSSVAVLQERVSEREAGLSGRPDRQTVAAGSAVLDDIVASVAEEIPVAGDGVASGGTPPEVAAVESATLPAVDGDEPLQTSRVPAAPKIEPAIATELSEAPVAEEQTTVIAATPGVKASIVLAAPPDERSEARSLYSVQVGSFKSWQNASESLSHWSRQGFDAFLHLSHGSSGEAWYTVRIGEFPRRDEAEMMQRSLMRHVGVTAVVVPLERATGVGGPESPAE